MAPNSPISLVGEERYLRQRNVFRRDRRESTLLAVLCGDADPWTSAFLKAGAAAMGVPAIASDFHGLPCGGHWLRGPHDQLVAAVNPEGVRYEYIVPAAPAMGVSCLLQGRENAWGIVMVSEPEQARWVLEGLRNIRRLRVLLVAAGTGGLVVRREPDPAAALDTVASLDPRGVVPVGPAELSIAAAGLCLSEVVLGGATEGDDLGSPRTVGFYSLHRARRVDVPSGARFADLVAEVARPPATRASFRRRRIVLVGAGALGNWTSLALALDGGPRLHVVDGDHDVAPHNLNRQILLLRGLGRGTKAPVLVEELTRLDPEGDYTASVRFVRTADDLGFLGETDVVIAAPDNDAARTVCADAAREAQVLFGQGGTGATGGQETVHPPGRPCLRCTLGDPKAQARSNSCWLAAEDSIVSSNMVVAGLLVSEMREALSARRAQNVRFIGDGAEGNRLVRMLTDVDCPHVALAPIAELGVRRSAAEAVRVGDADSALR